jgi:hypothetical protein
MRIALTAGLVFLLSAVCAAQTPVRTVENNVLVSSDLPKIRIAVDKSLPYLGTFHFNLRNIAEGDRYIWAETRNGRVTRMFIVQFEGLLHAIERSYTYQMRTPVKLGNDVYSHNLWFYTEAAQRTEHPKNEPEYLANFLAERGLRTEHDLMMSRFARIVDDAKRHEIILFYWENMADHRFSAKDFPEEKPVTPEQKKFGEEFFQRSLKAFSVEP